MPNSSRWKISSRQIGTFFLVGLLLAFGSGLLIVNRLADTVSQQSRERELALLFGALQAGPVAIARLQAAEIAQQQLIRLMAEVPNRGFLAVKILGGPNGGFQYAEWSTAETGICPQKFEQVYNYAESLNPFVVQVDRDNCFVVSEQHLIVRYSIYAGLMITLLTTAFVVLSIWPVATSVRAAERAFRSNFKELSSISFTPIASLVRQALRSVELEREQALVTIAQQVSHDIRSPITALKIGLATLETDTETKKTMIRNAAERIEAIAQDLLERKKSIGVEGLSPVREIVLSVVEEKKIQAPTKTLVADIQCADRTMVHFPPNDLSRVVSNIVGNAIEAANEITVAVREMKTQIEIAVIDNGAGIPPEILAKLGHQQVSYGKSGPSGGTGLGLWNAQRLLSSAGGRLDIQSKVGLGTIVRIILKKET